MFCPRHQSQSFKNRLPVLSASQTKIISLKINPIHRLVNLVTLECSKVAHKIPSLLQITHGDVPHDAATFIPLPVLESNRHFVSEEVSSGQRISAIISWLSTNTKVTLMF